MMHFLKTWPQYFEQIRLKRKTFEIRKDDRGPNGGPGFMIGDVLVLEEWVPKDMAETTASLPGRPPGWDDELNRGPGGGALGDVLHQGPTGRFIVTGPIPYIMRGSALSTMGLEPGHVIMSLVEITLMEAPMDQPPLTRIDVEAYLDRVKQIRKFKGSLNSHP
jgi:hypothetical protein